MAEDETMMMTQCLEMWADYCEAWEKMTRQIYHQQQQ
jgi:hypothetical protein